MMVAVFLMASAVAVALVPGAGILQLVVAMGGPWAFGWHMAWQMRVLDIDKPETCLRMFRANRDTGLLPALFFATALLL